MANTVQDKPLQGKASDISRRVFLTRAGAILAGGLLYGVNGIPAWASPAGAPDSLSTLHEADFRKQVGQSFRVNSATPLNLVLVGVEHQEFRAGQKRGPAVVVKGGEAFSLLFRGSLQQALRQNTYNLTLDQLGSFSLFLVPGAKDKDGWNYVATFNRKPT